MERFPSTVDEYAVHLNLTNMRGSYDIELPWVRGDTEEEFATRPSAESVVIESPLARVPPALAGQDLPIAEPGRYVLRLCANGKHVQDHVTIVVESVP